MKPRLWNLIVVLSLAVWSLGACTRQEPAAEKPAAQQPAAQAPAGQDQSAAPSAAANAQTATGGLENVDVQAKTLTIKDETGAEQTFAYTDSTEITGTGGTQGLSSQQGSQVMVQYAPQDGRNVAVRIDVLPR